MISFSQCSIRFSKQFLLEFLDWSVSQGDTWAVLGPNGSGKSALISAVLGEGQLTTGVRTSDFARPAVVSLEEQARLIAREQSRDDSDITDEVNQGTLVRDMIAEVATGEHVETLIDTFGVRKLLDRGFRKLSTGETRRILFIRALASEPDLLLLDEPFEGLDADTVPRVRDLLAACAQRMTLIMVLNRVDEIADFTTHVLRLECSDVGARITQCLPCDNASQTRELLKQISRIRQTDLQLPGPENRISVSFNDDGSLVRLREGRVAYTDNLVFEGLNWTIRPGEHWQVRGPNGSGKTCLLSLITGDHPQCYVNDIALFGFQRGSGESIWQIKQHLGFVSTALHWDYRLGISVRNVILSGFHDTIGVYRAGTDQQRELVDAWLHFLGLEAKAGTPFAKLSYGEQRVLLIARAMVKHPQLLLLDEPCLGLDEANRQLVLAMTERLCSEGGTTLVYVTHHQEDRISCIEHELDLAAFD